MVMNRLKQMSSRNVLGAAADDSGGGAASKAHGQKQSQENSLSSLRHDSAEFMRSESVMSDPGANADDLVENIDQRKMADRSQTLSHPVIVQSTHGLTRAV